VVMATVKARIGRIRTGAVAVMGVIAILLHQQLLPPRLALQERTVLQQVLIMRLSMLSTMEVQTHMLLMVDMQSKLR
jgi:hypothetical protein